MTYSELILYLKANLDHPSLDFNWTEEDNKKFFAFIHENADKDYLTRSENLIEIRQAFRDYFESVGYILFQIKDYRIRLKVFPYTQDPAESENVNDIIDIIDGHEDLIVDEYNGRDDQILIKDELRKKLFDFVDTISDQKVNKKELVKHAVREAFELKDSDIIMIKTDSIFVKLFDFVDKKKVSDNEKNTIANRYNGIDEDELIAFYKEHFSRVENKNFFNLVAKLFTDRYLLDKNIDNHEYEKNVFMYIQSIITEQLVDTFDHNDEFFKGFSGYVFRRHFHEVFDEIAELILVELAMSNDQMIEFLKYYSLDIVVIGGVKYRVPVLEAESGLRWNVVSMLSIVKLYIKTKTMSQALNNEIDEKEDEMEALSIEGLSPVAYNHKYNEEKKNVAQRLVKLNNKLDKYYDSLKLAKNEHEKDTLQKEIKLIKADMQKIREEREKLLNKVISRNDIHKFNVLGKEIDAMFRLLKREERILKQNGDAFKSIKNALVKALTSKKQQL